MTLAVDDYLYTQETTQPDKIGVAWIYVTRRQVLAIDGTTVSLSGQLISNFPAHSPPGVAAIEWCVPSYSAPEETSLAAVNGGALYQLALTLPDPFVFTSPTEQETIDARNLRRNHKFVNKEAGKAQPELEASQAFLFHVLDHRYPW